MTALATPKGTERMGYRIPVVHTRGTGNEEGFFTIYVLGLCVCVLFVGGLSLDLWRGFTERRDLASIADAAVIAGANQIDLVAFKKNGVVALDPVNARTAALQYINDAAIEKNVRLTEASVAIVGDEIQVHLARDLSMTLTHVLSPGGKYELSVTSAAHPQGPA